MGEHGWQLAETERQQRMNERALWHTFERVNDSMHLLVLSNDDDDDDNDDNNRN